MLTTTLYGVNNCCWMCFLVLKIFQIFCTLFFKTIRLQCFVVKLDVYYLVPVVHVITYIALFLATRGSHTSLKNPTAFIILLKFWLDSYRNYCNNHTPNVNNAKLSHLSRNKHFPLKNHLALFQGNENYCECINGSRISKRFANMTDSLHWNSLTTNQYVHLTLSFFMWLASLQTMQVRDRYKGHWMRFKNVPNLVQ